ncbi:hypothetical protein [Streptomyces sp. NRRL S-87]|uniref:hypothetical protein n=1 Tax=Streptomyces sp. NRRL S-87 TaxID=1463920 RepID=UPI0004C0794D|nr:hypothetical protein [Streptomyces sp. NRRL S-87]
MISEPELNGAYGDAFGPTVPAAPLEGAPPPTRERRPPAGWVWALGGALTASAVWAGGLYALGDRGDHDAPPVAYRVPTDLCAEVKPTGLARLMGKLTEQPRHTETPHAAVDWFSCTLSVQGAATKSGWKKESQVYVTMAVHKKTDPEPEFDADVDHDRWALGTAERSGIVGLGEQAVMLTGESLPGPQLRVVDGGVVFSMEASENWGWAEAHEPKGDQPEGDLDDTALQSALVEDMGTLMNALKKRAG